MPRVVSEKAEVTQANHSVFGLNTEQDCTPSFNF